MRECLEKHIITGDETLIHQYKPESKQQSMQWKTHNFSCFQEILIMAFSSQDYANSVLGFQRPQIWDRSNKSWVYGHCNQLFAHNRNE